MSGIVIQNKGSGRGMMLPVREGTIENRLPFVSACGPIGLNPTYIDTVIIKSKKLKPIVKVDKEEVKLNKKYPLENYRKLKTTEAFWRKNQSPLFGDFNLKQNENKNENLDLIETETKFETIPINKRMRRTKIIIDEKQKPPKIGGIKKEVEVEKPEKKFEEKLNEKFDEKLNEKVDQKPVEKDYEKPDEKVNLKPEKKVEEKVIEKVIEKVDEKVEKKDDEKVNEMNKDEAEKILRDKINEDRLLEDLDDNENIDDIVDYLNGLDYDKYCKDKQIREALELLKNKMNKECEEKEKENEKEKGKVTVVEDESSQKKEIRKIETDEEKNENKVENKLKLPEINSKIPEQKNIEIVDDEEIKRAEEIKKYKIAEKIAKTDEMKAVHSVNSIRKLLQREGLESAAPLQITIIKENPIATTVDYEPNKLPFLHSLPLV